MSIYAGEAVEHALTVHQHVKEWNKTICTAHKHEDCLWCNGIEFAGE